MENTYYLFGMDAINHFHEFGIDSLINTVKNRIEDGFNIPFALYAWEEGDSPTELLNAFDGWDGFIPLTQGDYNKLLNVDKSAIYYQPDLPADLWGKLGISSFEVYRSRENCLKDFPDYEPLEYKNGDIENPTYID